MKKNTFIIAEVGVNHNGDVEIAKQLIKIAHESGADAVKFQTFQAEKMVTPSAQKTDYQKQNTGTDGSQLEMLQMLQLSKDSHSSLQKYSNELGIEFLSTPFDLQSLNFIAHELQLAKVKISSGDITNGPLLHACAKTGSDIILSTGMSNIEEIKDALGVLAHGYVGDQPPNKSAFEEAYNSTEGNEVLQEKVTLLHCTSQYPAPIDELHLHAIPYMKEEFGLRVGYSDHSDGITASVAAVAIGADVIEKHLTLDKNADGPDHRASLNPEELSALVTSIRIVDCAMGEPKKTVQPSEQEAKQHVRKSIVAACDIVKGDLFSAENMLFKRPGTGESPMEYWNLLGQSSRLDCKKDDSITS